MKRIQVLFIVMLFAGMTADAQLKVNSTGKVGIATGTNTLQSRLSVGWNSYFDYYNSSIGIAATPESNNQFRNLGIAGIIKKDANNVYNHNFGVFGLVSGIDSNNSENYGVSGMIENNNVINNPGGSGILGSSNMYPYYYPITISGSQAGYFYGPVIITGTLTVPTVLNTSDARLKENIIPLSETDEDGRLTLERVSSMNVVEYNFKNRLAEEKPMANEKDDPDKARAAYEAAKAEADEMASRRHLGLVAQELQAICPDMVQEGQDGYLAINYTELVPLLIRSIQTLKQELDELKAEGARMALAPQATAAGTSASIITNKLFQNSPNPFTAQTVIRFQLAEDAMNATIYIFDMQGKELKQIPVYHGQQSVTINGYELSAGMYLYSLVVNGQEIETKRMILSK